MNNSGNSDIPDFSDLQFLEKKMQKIIHKLRKNKLRTANLDPVKTIPH